jgi:hypothetical protein
MGFDAAGFGTPIDPDAAAFFARVTAAGGTLSATEQTAVNTLVVQMKADGTWAPMKAIYPMVGASAAACAQNLKSSSFTGTFGGAWGFSSNGVQGNGTNTYFDTALTPSTTLSNTSEHLSFYSRTNINEAKYDFASGNFAVILYSNTFYVNFTGSGIFTASFAVANTLGFYLGTNVTGTSVNGYRNGTKVINNSPLVCQLATTPMILGASTTTPSNVTAKQYAFASIGDGLNDTQASNFYTAVQAFNTTLSRQV